jgi:hypothetical protein
VVDERGKWSGGRSGAFSESQQTAVGYYVDNNPW